MKLPTSIELKKKSRLLAIEYGSDRYELPFEFLRVFSPSAEVQGHTPDQAKLQVGKRDVDVLEILPIGSYALQIKFSDGHDSGIYSYDYLEELGKNKDSLWQAYLEDLKSRLRRSARAITDMNEQNQKENRAEKLTDFGFSKVKEADKEKQVKAVFDQVAPKYDLMNDVLSFGMHRLWKQYAIDRAEIQPGMKVLDIAGGTGDMSLLVQKKLSGTGEVWLSDINHEMLKIGDERLKNAGYHPYVLTCDAEYLPFPDGYFDVLIVSFGLRNMTHKDRALREMQRVLKPGGRLMVLEFSKPVALMRPFYDFYSFKVMPFLSAKIAGHSENYRYLAESIRMHPDQKTLAKIMREAGFERVEWKNLTFGITALHIGYKN